jgi:1,4-dihydroxy-6-naphthoate synthase
MDQVLTLGHSPDPDDAFMFYALARNLIPTGGLRFEHILQDIQTLNERATRGELDISAVSIHAYAYVSGQYALLPSGASMGDGYGPMLVARRKFERDRIARLRIAVPGTMTRRVHWRCSCGWISRTPGSSIRWCPRSDFRAVTSGEADVGLIIHEGQLTYQNEGLLGVRRPGRLGGPLKTTGCPCHWGDVVHKRFRPPCAGRFPMS